MSTNISPPDFFLPDDDVMGFYVHLQKRDEQVQFNTARSIYNVGDTVTLTCYLRSSWLMVSFGRNNSDLGVCYTISGCASTDDMRDERGNYELKLVNSRPMLVIKNVTRDDDGAEFTCHWTTYTVTLSFAVTDKAVTTPSMPEENMADGSVVVVVVIVSVSVIVLVLVIVGIVIVRQPVCYSRIVVGIIDCCGRRMPRHGQTPVSADHVCTRDTGQEVQTNTYKFSDDIREVTIEDNILNTSV